MAVPGHCMVQSMPGHVDIDSHASGVETQDIAVH